MKHSLDQLYKQAAELSRTERAELANRLLQTLETEPADPGIERAWQEEIARRLDEMDSGSATMIPWEQARAQLWARDGKMS